MIFYSMKQLEETAVRIIDGMAFCWSLYGDDETATVDLRSMMPEEHKGEYSCRGQIISFVNREGELYIIPDLTGVREILSDNGYIHNEKFVTTFRYWTYPLRERKKWLLLLKEKNEELKACDGK